MVQSKEKKNEIAIFRFGRGCIIIFGCVLILYFLTVVFLCFWHVWLEWLLLRKHSSDDVTTTYLNSTNRKPTVTVAICSYESHIGEAYAQLRNFQDSFATDEVLHKFNVRYEVCHVNEIKPETARTLERLLNDTTVRDLSPMLLSKYAYRWNVWQVLPDALEEDFFQGYPCKPMCLSTNTQTDHIMLIDDDVLLYENPFQLLWSAEYQAHGHILFRDQLFRSKSFVRYLNDTFIPRFVMEHEQNYARVIEQIELRRNFLSNIEDIDKTDWVGESALVLINSQQHRLALHILQMLHQRPIRRDLYNKMLGDKETFWLSILLSGKMPHFTSYGMQIVGRESRKGQVCVTSGRSVLVQYITGTGPSKEPTIFYLNGQGIERLLDESNPKRIYETRKLLKYISTPIIGHQLGTCRSREECIVFNDSYFDTRVTTLARHRTKFLQHLDKTHYVFEKRIFFEEVLF